MLDSPKETITHYLQYCHPLEQGAQSFLLMLPAPIKRVRKFTIYRLTHTGLSLSPVSTRII